MVYSVVVGRSEEDRKKLGERGLVKLGRLYVRMGQTSSLSSPVYFDVSMPHVILIAGKRGSGKSTTASVFGEELAELPFEVRKRLTMLFFDTMGIFWTMRYPNERQRSLLNKWSLEPGGYPVKIFVPAGWVDMYKEAGIPVDNPFSLRVSELNASDWATAFQISLTDPVGILIERILGQISKQKKEYGIDDIISHIRNDVRSSTDVKNAAENRFTAAQEWGIFDAEGTSIEELLQAGASSVLDLSVYTRAAGEWSIKGLVVGIVCRKILETRIVARKQEEVASIQRASSYFFEESSEGKPLVWIMIDEAHNFLQKGEKSPASDALIQLLREGRQPGISLVMATQQPGVIHQDALTQTDIVISHRLTAAADILALNSMMQSYLYADLQTYLNELPRERGSALVLDDNNERIFPIQVRPKKSWHGGETPSAVIVQKKPFNLSEKALELEDQGTDDMSGVQTDQRE